MNDLPAPPALRPLLAFTLIAFCLGLSSCQCSWDPDVGPVEDEEEAAAQIESMEQYAQSGRQALGPLST